MPPERQGSRAIHLKIPAAQAAVGVHHSGGDVEASSLRVLPFSVDKEPPKQSLRQVSLVLLFAPGIHRCSRREVIMVKTRRVKIVTGLKCNIRCVFCYYQDNL